MALAESFRLEDGFSVFAGVVARRDGVLEDVAFALATVGGVDATEAAASIIQRLLKPDVSIIMLDGCLVSFYNWVDGEELWRRFETPVACYVFEEPEGRAEEAVKKLFNDWESRVAAIKKLGPPTPYYTRGGYKIYVRAWGIDPIDAGKAAEAATKFGRMPEPIRMAQLIARGARPFVASIRRHV
ncbi:MAG: DUF99 family protein [Pyrobaculum sp.]